MTFDANRPSACLSDRACAALLERLFPQGLAGPDVLAEIAPAGWEASPLVAAFHPAVEVEFEEYAGLCRRLDSLVRARSRKLGRDRNREREKPPNLAEFRRTWKPTPVNAESEPVLLVGRCLWDIVAENHELVRRSGRRVDLGSFRHAGGRIADFAGRTSARGYDYLDFYMGTTMIRGRADLTPVYVAIFRRLRRARLDWAYSFPRVYLISFKRERKADVGGYDPSASFAQEQEDAEEERQTEELRRKLDADHRRAVRAARRRPPPETVAAYRVVYGRDPEGWPPRA